MDFNTRRKKFFEGKMTRREAEEFLEFLESPEAEDLLSAEIISLWTSQIKSGEYQWDREDVWNKIDRGTKRYPKPYLSKESISKKYIGDYLWKAAVLLLLVGVSAVFFLMSRQEAETGEDLPQNVWITKSNPGGEKTKITLQDGSVVYLNSESSISYPEEFKEDRTIQLVGEAFFDVQKDPTHPFTVEANGILTTALGTSFNISTFNKEEKVTVTLLTGKVKLQQQGGTGVIELDPGEESFLSVHDTFLDKNPVSAEDRILWTQGILKFDEAPFGEMKEILQRWYGVKITVLGTPNKMTASGLFDRQESLQNVLSVMGRSMEFDYELEEDSITITFK